MPLARGGTGRPHPPALKAEPPSPIRRPPMSLDQMRTYTLHVGKMGEAVKLYQEFGFPALQKGGHDKKLIGYFQADTGMINQLVHLWKFEDDADRRAHWEAVFANSDFVVGFASEIPPAGGVAGGEAAPCRAPGAASLIGSVTGLGRKRRELELGASRHATGPGCAGNRTPRRSSPGPSRSRAGSALFRKRPRAG